MLQPVRSCAQTGRSSLSQGRHASAMRRTGPSHAKRSFVRAAHVLLSAALAVVLTNPAHSSVDEPLTPLAPAAAADPAKVDLGRKLFMDPRVSQSGTIACVSCHRLDRGGDDGRRQPVGADGRPLDFNSPSIFNAALNFRLNWRGN